MNPIKIVKAVSNVAVSLGAGAIINNAIKATTPEDVKMIKKITIAIGGFAISGLVADAAVKHTMQIIDDVDTAVKNTKVHNITDVE